MQTLSQEFINTISKTLDAVSWRDLYKQVDEGKWVPEQLHDYITMSIYRQEHRRKLEDCSKLSAMGSRLKDDEDKVTRWQLLYIISYLEKVNIGGSQIDLPHGLYS